MALVIPSPINSGDAVSASPLQTNFEAIASFVNASLVHKDGSVPMSGELQLVDGNNAASVTQVATAVAAAVPTGWIAQYAGPTAPSGYLLCDGTAVSRTTYATLFALVGTTFGIGNGTTTFNLPNLKGRVPIGLDAAEAAYNTMGETGGVRDAVVVTHDHSTDIDHNHGAVSVSLAQITAGGKNWHIPLQSTGGDATVGISNTGMSTETVAASFGYAGLTSGLAQPSASVDLPALGATSKTSTSSGVAATDKNMQPYMALNFIIKT